MFWFRRGHRDLPWRRTSDPYRIWLSEIMLQQTRSAAAIPFYREFLNRFPTVEALALAPESEVLAAWSGLGYYSRARNLRKAAQAIAERGAFPQQYDEIRALSGVGPYTAAAVASIAFGLPHAVLDGNVMRVLARLFADPGDIAAGPTKRRFQDLASGLLDRESPGTFNQAMMELGATVCLPKEPMCLCCPVREFCEAQDQGTQTEFPMKRKKAPPREESLEVAAVRQDGRVLMQQRPPDSSRMAGFWELPGVRDLPEFSGPHLAGEFQHTIVNHRYRVKVYAGESPDAPGMEWIHMGPAMTIPITTVTRKALAILEKSCGHVGEGWGHVGKS